MAKKFTHKGIKEFTGDESSNLFMNGNGFHLIKSSTGQTRVTAQGPDTDTSSTTDIEEGGSGAVAHNNYDNHFWCAIKAINGNAVVNARSITQGDDLNTTGSYASAGDVTLLDGDIMYGAFDAITVTGSNMEIIAVIGR